MFSSAVRILERELNALRLQFQTISTNVRGFKTDETKNAMERIKSRMVELEKAIEILTN